MEELLLTKPTGQDAAEIAAYRAEFLACGSSMDGCGSLRRMEDPREWLRQVAGLSKPDTVPAHWVQCTQFLCVHMPDRRILGMLQIRHSFNEYIEKYAGHIGYSVRPSERRKGYAKWMLAHALPYCREIGLDRVLISCEASNEASRRTILANGGIYESTVQEPESRRDLERYWINLL